jgi:hypothetical protein
MLYLASSAVSTQNTGDGTCQQHHRLQTWTIYNKVNWMSTWYKVATAGRAAVSKLKHCVKVCCSQPGKLLGTVGGRLLNIADTICSRVRPE